MTLNYDTLPVAISIRRADGRYVYVNQAWSELFAIRLDEALERTDHQLALDPLALPLALGIPGNEVAYRDVYVTTRDKGRLFLELVERRLPDDASAVLCVHQDMTGIGWRMEDMSRAHHECEECGRLRLQGFLELTGDLCAPLATMVHQCEALQAAALDQPHRERVDILHANALLLQRQVEQVFSTPVAPETPADGCAVVLEELIRTVAAEFRGAERQGLQVKVDPRLGVPVHAEEGRLRQILVNMVASIPLDGSSGPATLTAELAGGAEAVLAVTLSLRRGGGQAAGGAALPQPHNPVTIPVIRGLVGILGGRFEVESGPGGSSEMRAHLRLRPSQL